MASTPAQKGGSIRLRNHRVTRLQLDPREAYSVATAPFDEFPGPDYYQLSFARAALAARLDAIESAIAPGASIVDLGCNDGRIARHLLARGVAHSVIAVDLFDLIREKPEGLTFIRADLCDADLEMLPEQA